MTKEEAIKILKALPESIISIVLPFDIEFDYKQALDMAIKALEQESKWIPIVKREPTEEEKAECLAQKGKELSVVLENEMPSDGQRTLVSIGNFVREDIFWERFQWFDLSELEDIDAWMPMPKSYKEESEGTE